MKQTVLHVCKALGLFALSRWLTRRRLRILCYHGTWVPQDAANTFNFLYMRPQRFARRMALLQELGLPILPLGDALRRLRDGTLPPNAVAITIDDGWYGTYSHMLPEIMARGWPATVYLTTHHAEKGTAVFGVALQHVLQTAPTRVLRSDRIPNSVRFRDDAGDNTAFDLDCPEHRERLWQLFDRAARMAPDATARESLLRQIAEGLGYDWNRASQERWFRLMTLDEAGQYAARGIDFELHTHRHRVADDAGHCITQEIADNRARLALVSTRPATHFCYPSGVWNPDHFDDLRAAGVKSATTTDNGLCTRQSHPLALPRILDGDRVTEIEFESELCGLLDLKRNVVSWLRQPAV